MDSISLYRPTVNEKKKFLAKTYMWMGVALLISAAAALFTASSEDTFFRGTARQAKNQTLRHS